VHQEAFEVLPMMLVRSRPSEVLGSKEGYEVSGTGAAKGATVFGFAEVDIEAWP